MFVYHSGWEPGVNPRAWQIISLGSNIGSGLFISTGAALRFGKVTFWLPKACPSSGRKLIHFVS
jgi:hypothetical protein